MTTSLSLHQMTALDVDPSELVTLAAQTGCGEVSIFVHQQDPRSAFPLVTRENRRDFEARLNATGVRVANVEVFMIAPGVDIDSFRPGFALGAELGARGATVILVDTDRDRVVDALRRTCDMAAEFDLDIGIEFMPLMPAWRNLVEVADLISLVARPNLAIGLDVLHLIRSGGKPADITAIAPKLIAHAQLCDSEDLGTGSDYATEAAGNRLAPGAGKFPLQAILQALPAGTPLELEVPQPADRPARDRVADAVAGARRQMELAGLV